MWPDRPHVTGLADTEDVSGTSMCLPAVGMGREQAMVH